TTTPTTTTTADHRQKRASRSWGASRSSAASNPGAPAGSDGSAGADGAAAGAGGPTTRAASQVVTGTAATRPMLPTSVRTISVATISELATVPSDCWASTKMISNGSAAPA